MLSTTTAEAIPTSARWWSTLQIRSGSALGGRQDPPRCRDLRILRSSDLGLAQDIAAGIRGLAIISSVVVLLLFVLAVYLSRGYRWVTGR